MTTETKYLYFLILLYFSLSLVGILHHELWLDESHHWLLARDSTSFADLVKNTRYEGHPILWNILLYWITRFTLNPFWMQFLHICIATAALFVFLRKAPFNLVFKSMFLFGYFMFFEYNVISRNYMLGVLFLFLACAVFKDRKNKFILLCCFLALAANTHLMFGVIAFALFLALLFENFMENKLFSDRSYLIGYFIFAIALVIMAVQIIPPGDTLFFNHVNEMPFCERFIKGFISLFKGLVTIPDFTSVHFWNSNIIVNYSKTLASVLGLLAYIVPLVLFSKSRKTLFFVYIALFGTQIFFFFTQLGATRYDGINYIIIIIGLWIENYYKPDNYKPKGLFSIRLDLARKPIIYGLLSIQLFSGITAYAMDYNYSFCSAKAAVGYLKQHHLAEKDIFTVTCDGTLISPFLEKKVYFLCDGKDESYCHWYFECAKNITQENIVSLISDYMQTHPHAIFVSYYPIANETSGNWKIINGTFKIRFHTRTGESIVRNTRFYIYEVEKLAAIK